MYKINDSGKRRKFKSGMVRDVVSGKGRYDLLSPIAIDRLAKHFEGGALKYEDRNWEKGAPLSTYMDSCIRHCFNFMEGKREEDHLAAIMWNSGAAIHVEEMVSRGRLPKELDDLPNYLSVDERIKK